MTDQTPTIHELRMASEAAYREYREAVQDRFDLGAQAEWFVRPRQPDLRARYIEAKGREERLRAGWRQSYLKYADAADRFISLEDLLVFFKATD